MAFEGIVMVSLLSIFAPDTWHKFFFYLGTNEGNFYKTSAELVISVLLAYMALSEYLRTSEPERKQELKYLVIAFFSLLLSNLLEFLVFVNVVFNNFDLARINFFWPVLGRMFDLITLVLLLHAFIYPVFARRRNLFQFDLTLQFYGVLFFGIFIEIFWLMQAPGSDFLDFWGNYLYTLLQFLLIIYALYELVVHRETRLRYRANIFLAFWLYMMVPALHSLNIIFFDNDSVRLHLLEQPFPVFAILLLTQVTYLKLVDKAYLRERLTEAERKYRIEKELGRMKDEFVSVVSHELRTPLTSMKLYLGLLKDGRLGKIGVKQKEALEIVNSESSRLSSLINDILSLSKLEAGKERLKIEAFDLNLLKNPLYYAGAKHKSIRVDFVFPEPFVVIADKAKITQVFVNLIGNAIKFTDRGGMITVEAGEQGDRWCFSMKDSGRGIAKQDIPRLFDKFYQAEDHMTRTRGGTGLGLAIVKKIVDLHNGSINVESEPGRGSKFTVCIPKDVGAATAKE
jgi:signal transduction histidine kinase